VVSTGIHPTVHAADPPSELTTHQKRQNELRAQIEQLEAENVAKKDWTLMGEANARSRPQNSLLEEDLEFERVAKVVPVVTEEVIQRLEDRIKARILTGQFDDVVRQRAVEDKPFLPSRFFELQDSKSKQSLAEIYEDEYVAAQAGGAAGDDRDGKLRKEHEELTTMWDNICYKLDALCNAHFTPKQVRIPDNCVYIRLADLLLRHSRKRPSPRSRTWQRRAWSLRSPPRRRPHPCLPLRRSSRRPRPTCARAASSHQRRSARSTTRHGR
jgi:hypothetical protein